MIFTSVANAAPIPQYDQMSPSDKKEYRVLLAEGAVKALDAHGEHEQAQKLVALFTDKSENGGFSQFEKDLQAIRIINERNAKDPNNKQSPYEVEHALFLTLKDNDIFIPVNVLLAINEDFKPSGKTK